MVRLWQTPKKKFHIIILKQCIRLDNNSDGGKKLALIVWRHLLLPPCKNIFSEENWVKMSKAKFFWSLGWNSPRLKFSYFLGRCLEIFQQKNWNSFFKEEKTLMSRDSGKYFQIPKIVLIPGVDFINCFCALRSYTLHSCAQLLHQ